MRVAASAPDPRLAALAETAWTLEPPSPADLSSLRRDDAAELLDGLLVRLARGRGALELALGDGLAALAAGDRTLRLGFSRVGDYAYQRLGIEASTAEKQARLARALRERPVLRAAVRAGEVTARKAETVLRVARDEAEAEWVKRARVETVRALAAAVKEATGEEVEEEEPWERITLALDPAQRAKLDEALAVAGEVLGPGAPRWQKLEAICAEFLGAHPDPADAPARSATTSGAAPVDRGWLEDAKRALEEEYRAWEFLETVEPFPVPGPGSDELAAERDPFRLDEELRRLAGMRDRWDAVFGHVAMLLRTCGLWRDMKFASFGHYCTERLGMSERAVSQRIALERKLHELPAVREALAAGRISYEQARLVVRVADEASAEEWIARAQRTTCLGLRRELEDREEAQMCARGSLVVRAPARVMELLESAFRAARADGWRSDGECLARICAHFVEVWKVKRRATAGRRAIARDRGRCQVPGCSRAAAHAHHVLFRAHGGGDDEGNLVSQCPPHHLHAVHLGWVRVFGRAPDRLTWQLGVRPGAPPLEQWGPANER